MKHRIMIGLESHVQLATNSKLFCPCSAKEGKPNTNTCEICLGFPGSKPTLNEKAVEKAVEIALLLCCKLNPSNFARKIYFYPDLPKGFQIPQYDQPLAIHGQFPVQTGDRKKTIHITRVHIEEDPGKLEYGKGEHIGTARSVLVDYNRSGIPLCEIVTEPDFTSVEEAVSYVKKLFHLLSYLDIIDPAREGVMRTDANISMDGGARVELKNISGSDAIERALKAEINRQAFLKAQGKKVERETRTYSEETSTTILLRKKEFEEDYGYIHEPDLLPLQLPDEFIRNIKNQMKKLPEEAEEEIKKKYRLTPQIAYALAYKRGLYAYYQTCLKHYPHPETLAKWLIGDFLKCANWHNYEIEQCPPEKRFLELLKAIDDKKITEREAKELIKKLFDQPAMELDTLRRGEAVDVDAVIRQVLVEHAGVVSRIRQGEEKSIHFLVGQVLRKINFKGDPKEIGEKIVAQLGSV